MRTDGRTDVRTDGRTDVRTDGHVTIASQPKLLGLIGYHISLAMELRWRALLAGSAIKKTGTCGESWEISGKFMLSHVLELYRPIISFQFQISFSLMSHNFSSDFFLLLLLEGRNDEQCATRDDQNAGERNNLQNYLSSQRVPPSLICGNAKLLVENG